MSSKKKITIYISTRLLDEMDKRQMARSKAFEAAMKRHLNRRR